MNIRQYLLYKQAAGDEIMLPEGADAPTPGPMDDPAVSSNNEEVMLPEIATAEVLGPMDDTAPAGRSMQDDNTLQSSIDKAYGGRTADQIREDNSFYNDAGFADMHGLGGEDGSDPDMDNLKYISEFDKNKGGYRLMRNPGYTDEDTRSKWRNYEYNRINGIYNNMTSEEQSKYDDIFNARLNSLGYDRSGKDLYKTEAGTLPEPVSQPTSAPNDNFNVNPDGTFTYGDTPSEPMSASTSTEQTETNKVPNSQPAQQQPQRPSYQAMQQNKQELQEWDDHYNAIKQNIMNPSQIRRWEANGFTREQMEAYADREARKKATNRYGNRPNDIMEEYNYNMNAQASPQQQFDAPPMSREQMLSAQNKPPVSSQERLREGNPIYDREVSSLNKQIAKLQQRIQSGAGPFDKARNKLLAQRQLAMLQNNLDGIKALGLAPDGSFKGVQRMGKWHLQ